MNCEKGTDKVGAFLDARQMMPMATEATIRANIIFAERMDLHHLIAAAKAGNITATFVYVQNNKLCYKCHLARQVVYRENVNVKRPSVHALVIRLRVYLTDFGQF